MEQVASKLRLLSKTQLGVMEQQVNCNCPLIRMVNSPLNICESSRSFLPRDYMIRFSKQITDVDQDMYIPDLNYKFGGEGIYSIPDVPLLKRLGKRYPLPGNLESYLEHNLRKQICRDLRILVENERSSVYEESKLNKTALVVVEDFDTLDDTFKSKISSHGILMIENTIDPQSLPLKFKDPVFFSQGRETWSLYRMMYLYQNLQF